MFFGNKVVRALTGYLKKAGEVELRYQDGSHLHPSQIVSVHKDKLVLVGFAETLREFTMELHLKQLAQACQTTVTHINHDLKGRILYHCSMPETLYPFAAREERFFIYPKGKVVLSMEKGDDVVSMPVFVWSYSPTGVTLVNHTGLAFASDYRFFLCKIKVSAVESGLELKVIGSEERMHGKQQVSLLHCRFDGSPDQHELLLKTCKRIDRQG